MALRRTTTAINAAIVTAAFVVIAALAADLAAHHPVRWDFSADHAATLQPETYGVLDVADKRGVDVTVTAFSSQARDAESELKDRFIQDLLRELSARTPRLHTRFVRFDAERDVAVSKGVDRYGTVLVEANGERVDVIDRELFRSRGAKGERRVEFTGEASVARAIAQVLSDDPRKAYFLLGHGEQRRDAGLTTLVALLGAQGWDTADLDLLRASPGTGLPTIPTDADVVMIVGPDAPLTPEEDAAFSSWLGRGGRVGYFVEPGGFVASFLEEYGAYVQGGVVQDERRYAPHDDRPVLVAHPHPVTQSLLESDTPAVFAYSAPLELIRRPDAVTVDLVTTTRTGWIERGHESPPVHDASDGEGPVVAAAAIEVARAEQHPTRLLVVGDADVIGDDLLAEGPGNAAFAVNAVRWLAGDDDRTGPIGRPSPLRRVAMTEPELARLGVMLIGVWPALFLGLGLLVARARGAR